MIALTSPPRLTPPSSAVRTAYLVGEQADMVHRGADARVPKGPARPFPGSAPDTRPDLVEREFTAHAPDRLWVADTAYCRTYAGWVYAAFVLEVFSRRVVGWQLSTSLHTDLALDAINMGLWTDSTMGTTPAP